MLHFSKEQFADPTIAVIMVTHCIDRCTLILECMKYMNFSNMCFEFILTVYDFFFFPIRCSISVDVSRHFYSQTTHLGATPSNRP